MRSCPAPLLLLFLFLFLPPLLLTLDLEHVNDKALENETHVDNAPYLKLDCVKDIGVKPLDSLRSLRPYYQIFILDLTTPVETFARIRLLFVQAVCLYAAASNHIRIGYIALVNKTKVMSEPSIPDIREFIGMWTETDEKLLRGFASKFRQNAPLTHCEKADLLGHIIGRFHKMSKKPFRFLIIDDQKSDDQANADCDQAYEFGKALWRRNISLDNFVLDEVVSRDQDHSSGRRMSKAPVFTMGSLDDTDAFMKGMNSYVESLKEPSAWNNEALKSMIRQNEEALDDEPDYVEPAGKANDVIIEFPTADHLTLGSEDNMTNPDYFDDYDYEAFGVKKAAGVPETDAPSSSSSAASPSPLDDATVSTEMTTTVATSTTTVANATAAAVEKTWIDTMWWIIPVAIVALVVAFILFIVFCCWWDKRKLKTKMDKGVSNASLASTAGTDTPLVGVSTKAENSSGSSSKRPLRLTKSNHVAENSPEGAALIEKNLPDPYSPVKYINTPINGMPSEIEMTHTEHVAPPTMDEALNKHVVTPMEKVPELHIDDYNI